jgi:RimJ/RimL family protein N-acetyltransferase
MTGLRAELIRLLPVTPAIVAALAEPEAFTQLTGAQLGEVAALSQDVVAQGEAHRAFTGAPPEWGGFLVVDEARNQVVGTCAYTSAPDPAGQVEIAYFTFPPFERQGYGGAMAEALLAHAAASGAIRLVYAYTLPEQNASTRILIRRGFTRVGTAQDPEVGLVWRWEYRLGGGAGNRGA